MKTISRENYLRVVKRAALVATSALALIWVCPRTDSVAAEKSANAEPTNAAVGQAIGEYLSRMVGYGFHGAVLIERNGEVILRSGYGMSDREKGIPFSADAAFQIGSTVKDYTKIAVLQLEQAGRISVNDPIAKYLPGVPPDKQKITIQHLLDHTSGLKGNLRPDRVRLTKEELLTEGLASPLNSNPGEREFYSNFGYSLLAAIIENVSGQNFEQYVQEHIFTPAGMTHTGYTLPQWEPTKVARNYANGELQESILDVELVEGGISWTLRGNGGFLSTLDDMLAFHRALAGDLLLPRSLAHRLFPMDQTIFLAGGDGVFECVYFRNPAKNVFVMIVTTADEFKPPLFISKITAACDGRALDIPPQRIMEPTEDTSAIGWAGEYNNASEGAGFGIQVARIAGGLTLGAKDSATFAAMFGSGPAMMSKVYAERLARTARTIEATRSGDCVPLFEAFEKNVPLAQIQANQQRFWKRWQDENGPFVRLSPLGSLSKGPQIVSSFVAARFEAGTIIFQYDWDHEGRLMGWLDTPGGVESAFRKVGEGKYASVDPSTGEVLFATFSVVGADMALELSTRGSATKFRRDQSGG